MLNTAQLMPGHYADNMNTLRHFSDTRTGVGRVRFLLADRRVQLVAGFAQRTLKVGDVRMGVNYGLNKVRFTAPVPVGSRLRSRMQLLEATPIEGGQQLVWKQTIEREGGDKPVCVAETVARYYT